MKFSWKLLDYVLLGIAFNSAVCLFLLPSLSSSISRDGRVLEDNSSSKVEVISRESTRYSWNFESINSN